MTVRRPLSGGGGSGHPDPHGPRGPRRVRRPQFRRAELRRPRLQARGRAPGRGHGHRVEGSARSHLVVVVSDPQGPSQQAQAREQVPQ